MHETKTLNNVYVELFNYLIDNIYVCLDGSVFMPYVGIPMGTDRAPVVVVVCL